MLQSQETTFLWNQFFLMAITSKIESWPWISGAWLGALIPASPPFPQHWLCTYLDFLIFLDAFFFYAKTWQSIVLYLLTVKTPKGRQLSTTDSSMQVQLYCLLLLTVVYMPGSSKTLIPLLDNSRLSDCFGPIMASGPKETQEQQCYPHSFEGREVGLLTSNQSLDLKAGKGRCLYPHWTQMVWILGSGEVQGSPGCVPSFLFIVTFSSIDGSLNVNISQDS